MTRDFVGTGYSKPTRYEIHVEEGGKQYTFTQQIRGVPTSFQWDGAGPDSNDLARALLWVTTGIEPAWQMYRLFKSEVVSAWPLEVGECWRISDSEISEWLARIERDTSTSESSGQTQARLAQTATSDLRKKGFAATLKTRG